MTTIQVGWDDEGEPLKWPAAWAICPRCHGDGTHVNPNIDGNGITAEEMHELGEDFRDDYMAGVFNVACHECGGAGKILEVDLCAMSFDQTDAYCIALNDVWESRAVDRAEARAFGY